MSETIRIDAKRDLVFERYLDVPPDRVFAAWTDPDQLVRWFTPAPWKTVSAKVDLRPGGVFETTMRSPNGHDFPMAGCYLEIVPNRRLVWTDALGAGYRPSESPFITAFITMEAAGDGTKYVCLVKHRDEAMRKVHEEKGFPSGWGKATDQMVAMIRGEK